MEAMMRCKSCGGNTDVHLIDCRRKLGSPERLQTLCYGCAPEASVPGQRRYVVDRRGTYSFEERLRDLSLGPTHPGVH